MHNILIVDDESGIRQSLKDILEDEGYKAATADSGEVVLFDGADAIPLQQAPAFLGKPTAIAFSAL